MTNIEFKNVLCKCGGHACHAEKSRYQDRYKLYCGDCGKYIRFAKTDEKPIIKARDAWLKEHNG